MRARRSWREDTPKWRRREFFARSVVVPFGWSLMAASWLLGLAIHGLTVVSAYLIGGWLLAALALLAPFLSEVVLFSYDLWRLRALDLYMSLCLGWILLLLAQMAFSALAGKVAQRWAHESEQEDAVDLWPEDDEGYLDGGPPT